MTFGIPKEFLAVDPTGQVDLTNHTMLLKTIEVEEQKEDASVKYQFIINAATTLGEKFLIPGHTDIILGRGQHAKNTPGHLRFTQLLEEYQARYECAEKSQKTGVADVILKELKSSGCRFLKSRAKGGWLEVSDHDGREKINHAFRNLRSPAKKVITVSRTPSQSTFRSKTSKRALDDVVESWNVPTDALAPIPYLPTSSFPARKKRVLGDDVDSRFALDLLLCTNIFAS